MRFKEITNANYNELEDNLMSSYLLRKYHKHDTFDGFIHDVLDGKSEYHTIRVYDDHGIISNSLDINNDKSIHQYMLNRNLDCENFRFILDYSHELNNGYPFFVSGTCSAYMGDYDDENEVFTNVVIDWDNVLVSE